MRSRTSAAGWSPFVARLGLLLVLSVAAGCGPGRGKVSGQVLFHGAPLPGGMIYFRPADPKQHLGSAPLDEHGRYEAVLPAGEVLVSIDNRALQPRANLHQELAADLPLPPELRKAPGGDNSEQDRSASAPTDPPKAPGRYIQIPDKYYNPESSNLKFTVVGGDQERDFELAD